MDRKEIIQIKTNRLFDEASTESIEKCRDLSGKHNVHSGVYLDAQLKLVFSIAEKLANDLVALHQNIMKDQINIDEASQEIGQTADGFLRGQLSSISNTNLFNDMMQDIKARFKQKSRIILQHIHEDLEIIQFNIENEFSKTQTHLRKSEAIATDKPESGKSEAQEMKVTEKEYTILKGYYESLEALRQNCLYYKPELLNNPERHLIRCVRSGRLLHRSIYNDWLNRSSCPLIEAVFMIKGYRYTRNPEVIDCLIKHGIPLTEPNRENLNSSTRDWVVADALREYGQTGNVNPYEYLAWCAKKRPGFRPDEILIPYIQDTLCDILKPCASDEDFDMPDGLRKYLLNWHPGTGEQGFQPIGISRPIPRKSANKDKSKAKQATVEPDGVETPAKLAVLQKATVATERPESDRGEPTENVWISSGEMAALYLSERKYLGPDIPKGYKVKHTDSQAEEKQIENSFTLDDNTCEIIFMEKKSTYKSSKGARMVHRLILAQGKTIPALELDQLADTLNKKTNQSIKTCKDTDVFENESMHFGSSMNEPLLDEKAKANYEEKLKQLLQDRAEAEKQGNIASIKEIDEEVEFIEKELSRVFGEVKRPRKEGEALRIKKRVCKNIDTFIDVVRKHDTILADHLKDGIRKGYDISYKPDINPEWNII